MNLLQHGTSVRNGFDFWLRKQLTWSPAAHEVGEPKPKPTARERTLLERYDLVSSRDRMTEARWERNLNVLEHLERLLPSRALSTFLAGRSSLQAMDVGCKNFDYVDALAAFWCRAGSPGADRWVALTGLELDAHRRYTDFRTRRAWGEHYCSHVPGAQYLGVDVLVHEGLYDVVTWFFPFVSPGPLLKWGLPLKAFRPLPLLEAVLDGIRPEGLLVIVNHTSAEVLLQHELLRRLGRPFESCGGEKPVTLVLPR